MSVPPSMSDVDLPTRPTTTSPLLSSPGAVAGEGLEAGVALHYGDPMREQRLLEEGLAVVDLSHRDVVTVTGPDRLSWLHSLTTQHLLGLEPRQSREALILRPKGHVEHALHVVDDGGTTWITTEPGAGPALRGLARQDALHAARRGRPRHRRLGRARRTARQRVGRR